MGFPHVGVVDRWLATPKRARIAHWSLSRDRRINMQLTNYLYTLLRKKASIIIICYFLDLAGKTDIAVAGDGRCDSPRDSASYCTYSLMDVATNVVVASNVVAVTEVKNSYNMEKKGSIRCLENLNVSPISI